MKPAQRKPSFNPWPWSVLGFFILFIAAAAAFVVFAVRQDMPLVREDYYEEEIGYQRQMDRKARTRAVLDEVALIYDPLDQTVVIRLPAPHGQERPTGRIEFYRPSDARLDRRLALEVSAAGQQTVSVAGWAAGFWRLGVYWEVKGEEFYADRTLEIGLPKS